MRSPARTQYAAGSVVPASTPSSPTPACCTARPSGRVAHPLWPPREGCASLLCPSALPPLAWAKAATRVGRPPNACISLGATGRISLGATGREEGMLELCLACTSTRRLRSPLAFPHALCSELPTHPRWLGALASWELRHPPQPQAQQGLQPPPPPHALQLFPAATLHSAQQCLRGLARGPLALRAALCHYLHRRAFILACLPADEPAHEADCYTRLAVLAAASACWQVAVRGDAVRQRLVQETGLEEAEGQEAAAAAAAAEEEEAKALRFLNEIKSIRDHDEEDEGDDTQQQELQQLEQGWEGPDAAGVAAPHRRGGGEQGGEQEERQELQILDITTTSSAGVGGAASGGSSPDRPPGLSHRVRLVPRRAKRGPQPQPLLPPAAETQPTAAAGAALAATSTVTPPPIAAALTGAAAPPPPPPSRVLYCLGPGMPSLLMAQALMHGVLVSRRVTLPQPLMQRLLDAAAPPDSAATPGSQPQPPPPPPPELDAQLLRQHLHEYRQRQLDVARLHGLPEVDLMVSGPAHATLALLCLQIHAAVIGGAPYWLGFQPEAAAAADTGGSNAAGSGPPAGPAAVLLRGLRPVLLPVQMHKEGHSFYKWNLIPRVTVNTTSK